MSAMRSTRLATGRQARLIEVNLGTGCEAVPLEKYASYNTRICRASGLTPADRQSVVDFMVAKIGLKYDNKNILDMLRYFFPTPPVPVRWRRRMLSSVRAIRPAPSVRR
jgi:hypothetical protein